MKVNTGNSAIELNAYIKQMQQNQQRATGPEAQAQPGPTAGTDTVQLSDRAREVQRAAQSLESMPDVREAKVAEVRLQVEKGTYNVVGAQVANDMMHESFENNLILQKINTRV